MANIRKPAGTKGTPVEEPSFTLSTKTGNLSGLNFKVSSEFRREFKTFAAENDLSMVEVLQRAFQLLKASQK